MTNATATIDTEIQALGSISERPSLVALAYALRHPETWPEGFVWDYHGCTSCAVGLAIELWPNSSRKPPRGLTSREYQATMKAWIARTMAMPLMTADDIFFKLAPLVKRSRGWFRRAEMRRDWASVYPEDVAAAIDRYLATAE